MPLLNFPCWALLPKLLREDWEGENLANTHALTQTHSLRLLPLSSHRDSPRRVRGDVVDV